MVHISTFFITTYLYIIYNLKMKQDRRPSLVYMNDEDETEGSIKKVTRLVYKISNEGGTDLPSERKKSIIPSIVIFLNIILSPLIGVTMAIRGHYDGKLSMVGLCLRVIYFISFIIAIYFDRRFENTERYARLAPKVFGVIIIGIQLIGVLPRYECNVTSWISCI